MAPIVEVITMLAARIATRTPMKRRNGPAFLIIRYPSKDTLRFCAQRVFRRCSGIFRKLTIYYFLNYEKTVS